MYDRGSKFQVSEIGLITHLCEVKKICCTNFSQTNKMGNFAYFTTQSNRLSKAAHISYLSTRSREAMYRVRESKSE